VRAGGRVHSDASERVTYLTERVTRQTDPEYHFPEQKCQQVSNTAVIHLQNNAGSEMKNA